MTTPQQPIAPTTTGPGNELRLWFIGSMLVTTCVVVSLARDVKVSFNLEVNRTQSVAAESASAEVPPPIPFPPGFSLPSLDEVPKPPVELPESAQCTLCRFHRNMASQQERPKPPALVQARHRISQP